MNEKNKHQVLIQVPAKSKRDVDADGKYFGTKIEAQCPICMYWNLYFRFQKKINWNCKHNVEMKKEFFLFCELRPVHDATVVSLEEYRTMQPRPLNHITRICEMIRGTAYHFTNNSSELELEQEKILLRGYLSCDIISHEYAQKLLDQHGGADALYW